MRWEAPARETNGLHNQVPRSPADRVGSVSEMTAARNAIVSPRHGSRPVGSEAAGMQIGRGNGVRRAMVSIV